MSSLPVQCRTELKRRPSSSLHHLPRILTIPIHSQITIKPISLAYAHIHHPRLTPWCNCNTNTNIHNPRPTPTSNTHLQHPRPTPTSNTYVQHPRLTPTSNTHIQLHNPRLQQFLPSSLVGSTVSTHFPVNRSHSIDNLVLPTQYK